MKISQWVKRLVLLTNLGAKEMELKTRTSGNSMGCETLSLAHTEVLRVYWGGLFGIQQTAWFKDT